MSTPAETFLRLADTLESQPAAAWDAPSLCERWRVREVAAHMSTAARYTPEEYMAELRADGGRFDITVDRLAERDGRLDPSVLLTNLRDVRLHRWIPPGGGETGALLHAVIHSLDITTPLGLPAASGEPALRAVLDALADGAHAHFGVDLDDVELVATDLDWRWGEGRIVMGRAADLTLAVTGRTLHPGASRAGDARIRPGSRASPRSSTSRCRSGRRVRHHPSRDARARDAMSAPRTHRRVRSATCITSWTSKRSMSSWPSRPRPSNGSASAPTSELRRT